MRTTQERIERATGWSPERVASWIDELAVVGRRSERFDADALVRLLRESRRAGVPLLTLAEAAGEPSSSVHRWIGGRRPTPAADRPRRNCAREGCDLPVVLATSELCERHLRSSAATEYERRFEVRVARGLERGRRTPPTGAQSTSRRSSLERRTERLRSRNRI